MQIVTKQCGVEWWLSEVTELFDVEGCFRILFDPGKCFECNLETSFKATVSLLAYLLPFLFYPDVSYEPRNKI